MKRMGYKIEQCMQGVEYYLLLLLAYTGPYATSWPNMEKQAATHSAAIAASSDELCVSEKIRVSDFYKQISSLMKPIELTSLIEAPLPYSELEHEGDDAPDQALLDELYYVTNPLTTLYPEGVTPNKPLALDDVPDDLNLVTIDQTRQDMNNLKDENKKHYAHVRIGLRKHTMMNDEHLQKKLAQALFEHGLPQKRKKASEQGLTLTVKQRSVQDVILKCRIMKPQSKYTESLMINRKPLHHTYQFTFNFLSSNTLQDLRDVIKCPLDLEIPGDWSNDPNGVTTAKNARCLFPCSMMYIEDVIYMDDRASMSQTYTKELIQWLKDKDRKWDIPHKPMSETRLNDLEIRLGHPYLFQHQGHCQHVILFSDLRIAKDDDPIHIDCYPVLLKKPLTKPCVCNTCQSREVRWFVKGSTLAPNDPCHFCDICFKMLHYNSDGDKVCNFQAYVYKDWGSFKWTSELPGW